MHSTSSPRSECEWQGSLDKKQDAYGISCSHDAQLTETAVAVVETKAYHEVAHMEHSNDFGGQTGRIARSDERRQAADRQGD